MIRTTRISVIATSVATTMAVAMSLALAGAAAASDNCQGLLERHAQAEQSMSFDAAIDLFAAARTGTGQCPSTLVYCMGRRTSRLGVDLAYSMADAGRQPAEIAAVLERAHGASPTWQAAFALAETLETIDRQDPSRFNRAAELYQAAIDDIAEMDRAAEICPGEKEMLPDTAVSRLILDRAAAASRLATVFVPPPTNARGEIGGTFTASLRGFTVEEFPVPVTFEYDSDRFTPKGKDAVDFLATYLKARGTGIVTLSGHTDARGSESYNCELSRRRLGALASYLKEAGFAGEVLLDARGETEPVRLDDPSRYSAEETDELNRRVELKLSSQKDNPVCG